MSAEEEATAQFTGNTNTVNCFDGKKKRMFQLTLNFEQDPDRNKARVELLKKYHNVLNYLTSLKYQYIISCIELNTNNYYHIHIFIQFDTPHKLNITKLEGAHVEICKGSVNQNIDYIKKDGAILDELGNAKLILGNPSIKDVIKTKMSDIIENINFRYYRICKEIKHDHQPTFNTPKTVYIIDNLEHLFNHPDKNNFNDYQFLQIKKGKIKQIWPNLVIKKNQFNKQNLDYIFNKFNEPADYKFYPADINNILIEHGNIYPMYLLNDYYNLINVVNDLSPELEENITSDDDDDNDDEILNEEDDDAE